MYEIVRDELTKKRNLSRPMLLSLALAILALAGCVALLYWAGLNAPPPTFKIGKTSLLEPVDYPLWQRASDWMAGRKYVLLTFDDGPFGHEDEEILATLAKHKAHAIFFEVCARITDRTIKVPREILESGSDLGNHSYSHVPLPRLHGDALSHEIEDCSDRIEAVSGKRPAFLRPPWGQTSIGAQKIMRLAGMQQVLWNANSGDTWLRKPADIIALSLKEVALGRTSILLMHSKPMTAAALDTLLTDLEHRGTRFVLPENDTGR